MSLIEGHFRMKISKTQGVVVAAIIAITFFSFKGTYSSEFNAGFTVEESKKESLVPQVSKEIVTRKTYDFRLNRKSDQEVQIEKESKKVK